jgi:hypothetical protein
MREIFTIALKSGAIIATGLNKQAKLSGNSERPAYPGFIVMNKPVSLYTYKVSSPNGVLDSFFFIASRMIYTY